jgi:hypothetical protein
MKLARLFGYCVLCCFFMACLLLSLGFHPKDLSLLMSSCIFSSFYGSGAEKTHVPQSWEDVT